MVGTLLALSGILLNGALEPLATVSLRYDLKAGDRLVFRTTLEQEIIEPAGVQKMHVAWTSYALVVASEQDAWLVGFARHRTGAEFLRSIEYGRGRLARDALLFESRIERLPASFADANRLDDQGFTRLPVTALREWPSETLFDVRELPPLPAGARALDSEGGSLLGMRFTSVKNEDLDGEGCVRVDARGDPKLRLRYWYSPSLSLPRRIEYSSEYPTAKRTRHVERLVMTFVERRRGQTLMNWLYEHETRLAVLEALRHAATPLLDPIRLRALAEQEDAAVLRRALALAHRFGQSPFSISTLKSFLDSSEPRVRAMTARVLDGLPESDARLLIAKARSDDDLATREAAASWQARQGAAYAREAVRPPEAFGTRIRRIRSARFPRWPYILHVPDEYRGDEPLPLLIVLGGGSGRALAGAQASRETLERTGWLVAFPQARGMWWHDTTTAMMEKLISEIGAEFNVDWDRVFIAGMSNGASGAYYFATLWPHRIAGIVSMMGAGVVVPGIERAPPMNAAAVPMLFILGEYDDIVPERTGRATADALRRVDSKAPVSVEIMRGRGHDISLDSDDGLALRFLARQKRDPFPRQARLRVRDLRHPRRYWIEVVEKTGRDAEVVARIEQGNVVRLICRNVRRLNFLSRPEMFSSQGPIRIEIDGREAYSGELPTGSVVNDPSRRTGDPTLDEFAPIEIDLDRQARPSAE